MIKKFQKFLGKKLINVADEAKELCLANHYTFSVLDPDFKQNIDKDSKRMNFYVDEDFIIRKVFIG